MSSETAQAQLMLLALKGGVSELPQEDQDAIKAHVETLNKILADGGQNAKLAFAIVTMELGIKEGS